MISKISRIADFGIFADWTWGSDLCDFRRFNVLYGWNYSGKTTLSRVFRCFECKSCHEDFQEAKAIIETCDAQRYSSENYDHTLHIRVFNEDFVEANIRWDGTIEPVLMLGEENIRLQQELSEKRLELSKTREEIAATRMTIAERERVLESGLTARAKEIKKTLSIPDFNKKKLEACIQDAEAKCVLVSGDDEQFRTDLSRYLSTDKRQAIDCVDVHPTGIDSLVQEATPLLSTVITGHIIERLRQDSELSSWVKKGKDLHEDKTICEFCGSSLPDGLLASLGGHFSGEYDGHIRLLDALIQKVRGSRVDVTAPDPAALYDDLRDEYVLSRDGLRQAATTYNTELGKLAEALESKRGALFDSVEPPVLLREFGIHERVGALNAVIQGHNSRTAEFESARQTVLDDLLTHYAAQFVNDTDYFNTRALLVELDAQLKVQEQNETRLKEEVAGLEQRLSDTVRGAEVVNAHIAAFFNRKDLQIEVTQDSKFELKRSGRKATNLSRGERTAISLAYFIAKLSEKDSVLAETVVFIDDPVSSLDANHLFNVYSFIRSRLADCRQLFVSTHNFEFLNLIKDWLLEKRSEAAFYLVERAKDNDKECARITNMPKVILDFRSEYHYLFSILNGFVTGKADNYDVLYQLPNVARRFLEAFLGFKVPRHQGLEKKMAHLFPDDVEKERVWKFVNHYSHNTSLLRSLNFPDFGESRSLVGLILERARGFDPEHIRALEEETAS